MSYKNVEAYSGPPGGRLAHASYEKLAVPTHALGHLLMVLPWANCYVIFRVFSVIIIVKNTHHIGN